METCSTSKKITYGILSILFAAALLYGTYTILFVSYVVWIGNLIMFFLNIWTIMLILFAMFADEKDKEKTSKNKIFPAWMHVLSDFALMVMFIASGWWYYGILCLIMSFFDYAIYSHKTKGIEK
jgi:hypothetical protein